MEEDDLGVLSAEFDGRSCLRMQVFDGNRVSDHFLDKVDIKVIRYRLGATTAHGDAESGAGIALIHQIEEVANTIGLLSQVPSVFGKKKLTLGIENSNLCRRRTDIDTQFQLADHEIRVAAGCATIMRDS